MTIGDLQLQLDSLDAFMLTTGYTLVQVNLARDIVELEGGMLAVAPDTTSAVAELNKCHGKRELLYSFQRYFEELRDNLKTEIRKVTESDTIIAQEET